MKYFWHLKKTRSLRSRRSFVRAPHASCVSRVFFTAFFISKESPAWCASSEIALVFDEVGAHISPLGEGVAER